MLREANIRKSGRCFVAASLHGMVSFRRGCKCTHFLGIDDSLVLPIVAVETEFEEVIASSWFAEDETSITAVSVASFARRVVIANKSHLYLAIADYLYVQGTDTTTH